jgi:hypothetical protein
MKLIVTEYPKSGGSWLVSMIGDALSLPKRDIYTSDESSFFDPALHPWYIGADSWNLPESCVIKSHELPDTRLHAFPSHTVHLIRDCRDVVVSSYFFHKDFCVKNGLLKDFSESFDEHVQNCAIRWAAFVAAWLWKDVITVRYEALLKDPVAELINVFNRAGLSVADPMLQFAVRNNTKKKMRDSFSEAFTHNTFVRKGIAGDWVNHCDISHKNIIKKYAGSMLIELGYAENDNW